MSTAAKRGAKDWSADQYVKFEDERTRPARDLLAQVPRRDFGKIVDIGCGPGNSTELLVERFHNAEIIGFDSSPDMLRQARERLPDRRFIEADVATWKPEVGTDLLFANAVFQWVPDRERILRRLTEALPQGGALAVQMPDNLGEPSHRLMAEVAAAGPWANKLARASEAREPLPTPQAYYELLKPVARHVDIWHTVYNHPLDGATAIVEWVKGTGLKPYIDPLDKSERDGYLATYTARIAEAYPVSSDGKALLRFPRMFILAVV
jgi:trans-aconitate 2-methyltransferase